MKESALKAFFSRNMDGLGYNFLQLSGEPVFPIAQKYEKFPKSDLSVHLI
jgi:hypothetical protein